MGDWYPQDIKDAIYRYAAEPELVADIVFFFVYGRFFVSVGPMPADRTVARYRDALQELPDRYIGPAGKDPVMEVVEADYGASS